MNDFDDALPKKTIGDRLHAASRDALSRVPGVGGTLVTVFEELVQSPIDKRRDKWLNDLHEGHRALETRVESLERLVQDEAFLSVFLRASRQALETHERAKLEALRNAVLNSAFSAAEEEQEMRQLYLSRLDQLRPAHLRVLGFLADPGGHASEVHLSEARRPARRAKFVTAILDDLRDREEFVELLMNDLARLDLLVPEPSVSGPGSGTAVTAFGRGLVRFISAPEDPA